MNTLNVIILLILSFILSLVTIDFSISRDIPESDQSISITDTFQEEEEDVYDGDEEQDKAYDEEQNEFVGGSEEDELDSELNQGEQAVESQEQTENEIDAVEEDINELP
jgi:hypothetical protein